jgi:hypothetical protein
LLVAALAVTTQVPMLQLVVAVLVVIAVQLQVKLQAAVLALNQ